MITRHRLIGPYWLSFIILSTIFLIGFMAGRAFEAMRWTSVSIAVIIGIILIYSGVYFIYWFTELIHDMASSSALREYITSRDKYIKELEGAQEDSENMEHK